MTRWRRKPPPLHPARRVRTRAPWRSLPPVPATGYPLRQNGPVTIKLNSDHWTGAGLEARTHNGPLELRVPENYRSGVEVAATTHAPFSCHHSECKGTWDEDNKQVHLGGSPTVVRLSTVNGPVSIAAPGSDDHLETLFPAFIEVRARKNKRP